ncbi:MAG: methionyl-tRNA formyltransferase [Pseudomonadota bacterium]
MSRHTFVLASSKPWHRDLWSPGENNSAHWVWVETPEELASEVARHDDIRYVFFLHWHWRVPERIWKGWECVCFHMTDLPYGRGGSPLQNLIQLGHRETRLSALRMVEELDAGPVYAKRPLSLDGSAETIFRRSALLAFELIHWMVREQPEPVPQEGEPVVFQRRTPEQSRLPDQGRLEGLYDFIRMLDAPTYPAAFLEHGGFVIEFRDAEMDAQALTATVRIRNIEDPET